MGISGTSTENNIQMVKTKLVSAFVSRLSPNLDADTLRNYLTEKLSNKSVTCRKIDLTRNRFNSFHVTEECNEVADMYDPQLAQLGLMSIGTMRLVNQELMAKGALIHRPHCH